MHRVGPPRFLGGILIVWGVVASLFAWMRTAMHFYILRFVLGLAESGAYPGAPIQCPDVIKLSPRAHGYLAAQD